MAVKLSAKGIFKIIGIVAACVVGVFGLIFGGVLLFGNNEPAVTPRDLQFQQSSGTIITGGLNLLITTSTEEITEFKVTLKVDNPDVLHVPATANIGTNFQVFAVKDANGNNKGGVAKITAYADNEQVVSDPIAIYVDTTANELNFSDFDSNIFSLNSWVNFDSFFGSNVEVLPSNARNPGHLDFGESQFDRNKTVYYFLLEDNSGETRLDPSDDVAGFSINGGNWINSINSTQVTSNTVLQVRDQQRYFYVQACMFKNFKDNDYYSAYSDNQIFDLLRNYSTDLFVMTPIKQFAVQDVKVGDMEVTGNTLPMFLYEGKQFVAYSQDNSLPNFGIRLIPADNNYDADVLDKFLGGVSIVEQGTSYLNITKETGTSGVGTTWTIDPINFTEEMIEAEGFNVVLKLSFTTFEGTLLEKTVSLNIKSRPLDADVVEINYKNMDYFVIDGSKGPAQNPEQISLGGSQNGQKYVTIKSDGSGIITFSNLMFYLNPADIDYIPTAVGTYKATFDFVKTAGIGPQVMHNGSSFAGVSWHYINADNTTGSVISTGALAGISGRVRAVCEGLTNPNSVNITFSWLESETAVTTWIKQQYGNDITINTSAGLCSVTDSVNHTIGNPEIMRNVKFYEINSGTTYNSYPYIKVKDKDFINTGRWITLFVQNEQLNTSTGLIDATDATFSAMGYGEFRAYAVVVATTKQGANIRDINGDYIKYKSAETKVVVTNKIESLNVYLTDSAGNKLDVVDGAAGDPTVYLPLKVAESGTYYLVLSIVDTDTPIGLLTQMIQTGFLSLITNYNSPYGASNNGEKLSIDLNSVVEVYSNGNPLTGELIGYRYKIEVGDIWTIEYDDGNTVESVPVTFKIAISAKYSDEDIAIKDYFVTVEDEVIKVAELDFYNGDVAEGENEKSVWAANMNADGSIVWNLATDDSGIIFSGNVVDLTSLKHKFYNEMGGSEVSGMAPIFEVSVDSSIAKVLFDGSRYVLVLGNVPYNSNGFEIVITVRPSSGNGRFVYTDEDTYLWQVYTEAVATYTLKVYGFKISVFEADVSTEYVGEQGGMVNLLGRLSFNITTADDTPVMTNNITETGFANINLSNLINFSISGGGVFALDENLMIEVLQDIPVDTTMIVGLKIGLTDLGLAYHNIRFSSPFSVAIDGAFEHQEQGVATGKAVIDVPNLEGINLNNVFEILNGAALIDAENVTYELDADSLASAGLADLVGIELEDDNPLLIINNFSGAKEIKIYIKTLIAEVDLGGGVIIPEKEVKLSCIIVLNNLWSEQDITGGINLNEDIKIVGDGIYNTLTIDLRGQDSRLSYITVSKQGEFASRIDYSTNNKVLAVRGFEATGQYEVTLIVTLHFVDDAVVTLTKTITVVPNLGEFKFADDEMGASDLIRVLNPGVITQTYALTPAQQILFDDYIEKAILYAEQNGAKPFDVDLSGTNLSSSNIQIGNAGGDQWTLIINYSSIVSIYPNVNYVIIPVKIYVPVYDASSVRYVVTYVVEMKVILNTVWDDNDVLFNGSTNIELPSDDTWYSLDSFDGKHGQTVTGVVVNDITGADADRVGYKVENNLVWLKAYEKTVSFNVNVDITVYFAGGGAANIIKTITFIPIEFLFENNLGVQSDGTDLLSVVLNDIDSYLASQQIRYGKYLNATGDYDVYVDFDNDGILDNDIQHVTFVLDPTNESAILSNVTLSHDDNGTIYDDSDDTYSLVVSDLGALKTAFSGQDYVAVSVLMTVFIYYDLNGDGEEECFIETYTIYIKVVLDLDFYDPAVFVSVKNLDDTAVEFMEIQTGTATSMIVLVDGIEVYNGAKGDVDLTEYLWADGTYEVRVMVFNDALDLGGHNTEEDKLFDETTTYVFSMTEEDHFKRAKYIMNGEIKDYYIESDEELELLVHYAILYQKSQIRFFAPASYSGASTQLVNSFRASYPEYDGVDVAVTLAVEGGNIYKITGFVYYLDNDRLITTAEIEMYYDGVTPKPSWYNGLDAWNDTHELANRVTKYQHGYEKGIQSTRTFAIDSASMVVPVFNTEQLFMAVQYGAKPNIQKGSVAEDVYLNARAVLSEINNSDSLTDYQKTLNIYRYLVNRVQYDIVLYEFMQNIGNFSVRSWGNFSVFYLESIFVDLDSQIAVCDGISKAFVLMCRIEGIYATKINGTANGGNHAWNEVKIGDDYYWVDATWGVLRDGGGSIEIANHAYFLNNSSDMSMHNATYKIGNNTTSSYNYYAHYTGQVGVDHYIESKAELNGLIQAYTDLPNFNGLIGIELCLSQSVTFDANLFSDISEAIANYEVYSIGEVNKRILYIEFGH